MNSELSRPILHGANSSPYVRKVRVALAFKGIEYDNTQQVPFGAPAEYVEKSPLSKVPCWEEDDLILPDSSVILSYLEHRYPEPPLLPAEPGPRARALWFEEYADGYMMPTLVGGVFFQRVVMPLVFKQETNEDVVHKTLNELMPKILDYLTQCLADDEFMVGGAFSIADIALASPFVNLAIAGEKIDAQRHPEMAAYIERIFALECYAPIVAEELPGG
ncbi:MAG: glutathione S-transferase family protein [Gammaproteobacteria bacterium]|nr:glutathione S-transferase family protein [Gammaproteobacteria bacterium]